MDETKKILLAIPAEVHRELKIEAESNNTTVSDVIRKAVNGHLTAVKASRLAAGNRVLKMRNK